MSLAAPQDRVVSPPARISDRFAHLAGRVATLAGDYRTFLLMLFIVIMWALTGPIFGFSTTWQLVINTGTTVVTFLMVFLIQNTQNREGLAMHLKLDEIIRAIEGADNELIRAEDETDAELAELKRHYRDLLVRQQVVAGKIEQAIAARDQSTDRTDHPE
ncbi:MAG: low affinity iron permease family protein [Chloroflexota bacterium]|nr:low affinity iron permease family protein [Chloroflexota bacterium]